jgi:hypothetical protein
VKLLSQLGRKPEQLPGFYTTYLLSRLLAARSRLAGLRHVTAELVEYHARTAGGTGRAIYRIEHGWPVETEEGRGRRRYVEGEFAEWVEH